VVRIFVTSPVSIAIFLSGSQEGTDRAPAIMKDRISLVFFIVK
jgi:hypothetical protein